MTPEGRQELEAVIAEMREAVLNADRPYPIAIFHESVSAWADRLALLLAEDKQITLKGIPVHICDKAPKNKPYIASSNMTICPFCGENFKGVAL